MFSELIQLIFILIGALVGFLTALRFNDLLAPNPEYYGFLLIVLIFTSIGLLAGIKVSRSYNRIVKRLDRLLATIPGIDLIIGVIGLLVGLLIALIISIPFLNQPSGRIYMLISFFVFGFLGLFVSLYKSREISFIVMGKNAYLGSKVVDTSVLIDGRILDLIKTGILEGNLLIYEEILEELQTLADSNYEEKRKRGQRGLKVLEQISNEYRDKVMVVKKKELPGRDVDERLIELARSERAALLTTDSNLALVARAHGINVININEVQDALKLPVSPGDVLSVNLIRKGRERNQGVGYLDDGTMVVVEKSADKIGKTVTVVVNGITTSSTGRVVFARLLNER